MVHVVGEKTRPAGRALAEDKTQEVTAVPPRQARFVFGIVIN